LCIFFSKKRFALIDNVAKQAHIVNGGSLSQQPNIFMIVLFRVKSLLQALSRRHQTGISITNCYGSSRVHLFIHSNGEAWIEYQPHSSNWMYLFETLSNQSEIVHHEINLVAEFHWNWNHSTSQSSFLQKFRVGTYIYLSKTV
jgi:hypothetical protein